MTGQFRSRSAVGLCVLILMGALGPLPAVAETPSPAAGTPSATRPSNTSTTYKPLPGDFALQISPTRLVLGAADAGTTRTISVINRGRSAVSVTVAKRNFSAGRDGSLNYQAEAPYAADTWVDVAPTSFKLPPGASQTVTAVVDIPEDPDVGDHQVAIVFLVPAGKSKGNVKINRGIATPVYIAVPGPVDSSAALAGLQAPTFAIGGPVKIAAQIHNTGTVHRDFRGATALTVVAAGKAAPFPDFTVPRGAVRDITTSWDPPLLCICHVRVTFGNPGAAALQTETVRVVIFPWPLALAVLAALALIFLVIVLTRRRYREQVRRAAALQQPVSGDA